jgi:Flp pilus assembly protein TadG
VRLRADERGVSAVLLAISLTVLIGFVALGTETGLWYSIKRQNQSAADAAVIAAAYEVLAGKTDLAANLLPAATQAATRNGYTGDTPVVTYPYSDAIVSNGVAVSLRKTQQTLLASLFLGSVTIETKAVATVVPTSPGCVLSLNTSGTDVGVSGSSALTAPDCSIMAASTDNCSINLHDQGGVIQAKYLITAGQVSYGQNCSTFDPTNPPSNLQANLMTGVSSRQFVDPYGASGTPSFTNSCSGATDYLSHSFLTCNMPTTPCGNPTGSTTHTYPGNCKVNGNPTLKNDGAATIVLSANTQIAGDLTIKNQTVNLSPGTYWITDGDLSLAANGVLQCTSCSAATGTGVTIIFTSTKTSGAKVGAPTMQSNPTINNLNAPGSGTYAGLLMVQDTVTGATYTTSAKFDGTPGQTLNGLVYLPNSNMSFQGNPSVTNSCLLIISKTLTLDGASSLATGGCANTLPLPTVKTVALAS